MIILKKIIFCFLTSLLLLFGGCSSSQPQLSQMQLREITTKEITGDYKTVFKATMNILQDQNYIINSAGLDTGLINCEKLVEKDSSFGDIMMVIFVDRKHSVSSKVNISATLTELNKKTTKLRLSIQETSIQKTSFGNNEKGIFIKNKEIYDSLFNQISVETERLKSLK